MPLTVVASLLWAAPLYCHNRTAAACHAETSALVYAEEEEEEEAAAAEAAARAAEEVKREHEESTEGQEEEEELWPLSLEEEAALRDRTVGVLN